MPEGAAIESSARHGCRFEGMIEDAQLGFRVGCEVASTDQLPAWKPGDEFQAARRAALGH